MFAMDSRANEKAKTLLVSNMYLWLAFCAMLSHAIADWTAKAALLMQI